MAITIFIGNGRVNVPLFFLKGEEYYMAIINTGLWPVESGSHLFLLNLL